MRRFARSEKIMRVVLDTSVLVSGLLGGALGVIIDEWKSGRFRLVVSEAIVHEYFDVISCPKFKITAEEITAATDYLLRTAEFVTPGPAINAVRADPSDDKFLEAALEGQADFVVSGDNHLLELKTFRGIPIISARQFVEELENQN